MNKRLSFAAICALISSTAFCNPVKILFLNTPTINIGGKNLKVGDTFDDAAIIKWQSAKQAMKVQNLTTKKQQLIAARQAQGTQSLKDFFSKTNHLSTRGDGLMGVEGLEEFLNNTFYLLDPIIIKSMLETNEKSYFVATFKIGNELKKVKLSGSADSFTIDSNIFKGLDAASLPEEIHVSIYYHDDGEDEDELISDKMVIVPITNDIK